MRRFKSTGVKITKRVEMPFPLELHKYLTDRRDPLRYKLIAAITHHGTGESEGHYTAVTQTSSSKYYLFNDVTVSM